MYELLAPGVLHISEQLRQLAKYHEMLMQATHHKQKIMDAKGD